MKAILPAFAAFAFVFAAAGCESMHHDEKCGKEACACGKGCTCSHCAKGGDHCDCPKK